ncbi:MAG: hypothetical protein GQ574_13725 [Crocinitomix sp.]|nr:hypothetical protein [Crocinitomix sp.]
MKNIVLGLAALLQICASCSSGTDSGENAISTDQNEGISETELASALDVEASIFEINTEVDTLLFGEKGTAVFIEAGSLEFEDGTSPTGLIEISIKEYYSVAEIASKNLTTLSNNELLVSGGMIELKAVSEGKELKLKNGKEVIVHFPKGDSPDEMNLFSGESNDGQITWNEEEPSAGFVKDTIQYWYHKFKGLDDSSLWLEDGRHIYDWIESEMILTKQEQDYVMFKDLNLSYTVTTSGVLENVHFKKKVDKNFEKRMLAIVAKIPKLKPSTIDGTPIEMEGWFKFAVKVVPSKYGSNKNYLQAIEGKYPDFENQSINDISKVELHYFIFNSAKLGWLNCDKFLDDPSPKVNMSIKLKKPQNLMIKMVFKDFKSVIPPRLEGETHYFNNIPTDKDITILIIRYGKKNVEMSITEQKTKNGPISNFDFKEYAMGDLKKELEKLN